jgi:hypothetical protein
MRRRGWKPGTGTTAYWRYPHAHARPNGDAHSNAHSHALAHRIANPTACRQCRSYRYRNI